MDVSPKPCANCGAPDRQRGSRLCYKCNRIIAAIPILRRVTPKGYRQTDYVSQNTGREDLDDTT